MRRSGARAYRPPLSLPGYKQTMPEGMSDECIREALAVMDDPAFAFLFAEGSLAEVPVAGCTQVNGKPVAVAGQIDRLCINEKEVWIIDFKSHRLPPGHIPAAYVRQMQLYRLLLQRIYPHKTVSCALLWTAAPKIVQLMTHCLTKRFPVPTYIWER